MFSYFESFLFFALLAFIVFITRGLFALLQYQILIGYSTVSFNHYTLFYPSLYLKFVLLC